MCSASGNSANNAEFSAYLVVKCTPQIGSSPFGHNVYNCTHQMNCKCIVSEPPSSNSEMLSTIIGREIWRSQFELQRNYFT